MKHEIKIIDHKNLRYIAKPEKFLKKGEFFIYFCSKFWRVGAVFFCMVIFFQSSKLEAGGGGQPNNFLGKIYSHFFPVCSTVYLQR